ncbi:class I adenylate-forming enzyme family protein [Chryseomicrobium aureum]|uniref:AMP-dependent synthetase n=1 Tax=Tetzosporium hominis TaxID=2020506 RepID=A0A264W3I8_9BACL|nr:long-chain fatty acid--CoA ligase [Tetzosporium hominis]OZS78125.1 AMP-dependent synthetase [Tetzosporium hominis]
MFITGQLAKHAAAQGDKVITSFDGRELTYQEFYEKAKRLAAFYQSKGLKKGDPIAFLLPNSDFFLVSYYAAHLGGFAALPINHKLAPPEIQYILEHSEAKHFIYDTRFDETLKQIPTSVQQFETVLKTGEEESLENVLNNTSLVYTPVELTAKDVNVIFYTSGTTGRPKGVMLSAGATEATAQIWGEAMNLNSEDRMQVVTPLFHCAASHVFSIPVIYAGGTIVIEEAFSPDTAMDTLENEDITIFFGVPAMYSILLNNARMKELNLPKLRLFTYGAAPMPYELVKKVKEMYPNVKVQNLYGQTENSPAATTLKDHYALDKIGSVGEVLPQTDVRVVDEFGESLPVGQVGEIVVKGPQLMNGYLKNEEATNQAIRNGWLYSGDLGRFDEDGLLYIVDRKKDMIIRGGENVYPVEVEEVLYQIPEILEAAVVGVPHPIYGEVPKAYVVLKSNQNVTEEDVKTYCSHHIAKYKVPEEIDFLDELPRNASGKVLKNVLREHQTT